MLLDIASSNDFPNQLSLTRFRRHGLPVNTNETIHMFFAYKYHEEIHLEIKGKERDDLAFKSEQVARFVCFYAIKIYKLY